ncbi:MAG: arabinosyltransferase domain-containing protein [Microbacterium sp.]
MTDAEPEIARSARDRLRGDLPLLIVVIVALLAGFGLAAAPVIQHRVDVSWPDDPAAVESTALLLINQTPHELLLEVDSSAIADAEENGGLVLATVRPDRDGAEPAGLQVRAEDGMLSVRLGASQFSSAPGTATWTIRSDVEGVTISRDGEVVGTWPGVLPPQIDALLTDVASVPADAVFHVAVQVVDDNATSPTVLKILILLLALLAAVAVGYLLWRDDRRRATRPERFVRTRPLRGAVVAVDILVALSLVAWAFIGPATADDGYYAEMARNNADAGFVGMYFQIYNQTFVPFVWYWQFYDVWQQLGGSAPFWMRLPAVMLALGGWAAIRFFVNRFVPVDGWRRVGLFAVAGGVTVVWWCALAIGVRPEAVAATGTVLALILVLTSLRSHRLLPAFGAVAVGSISFAAHPTGIVALAPILLSIVPLWRIAAGDGLRPGLIRAAAVAAGGVFALVAAFHDGSLFDAINGQRRFAAVERPLNWLDEFARYALLLENGPQGSYARRAVVLVALVLVLWFLIIWAWDRRSAVPVLDSSATLMGFSFALGFVLLWITTSKWSHHFGAMSALGALFIAYMIVVVPPRVAAALPRASTRWAVAAVATASVIPPMLLALNGPQSWFSWETTVPGWGDVPRLGPLPLRHPAVWILVLGLLAVAAVLVARVRRAPIQPFFVTTGVVVAFFGVVGVYMFGTFGVAAAKGLSDYSQGAANLRDPFGRSCLIDDAIQTWDAADGTTLERVDDEIPDRPAAPAVLPDTTPTGPITATGSSVWASVDDDATVTGSYTGPWFALPALGAGQELAIAVAGHLTGDDSTTVTVETRGVAGVITRTRVGDVADRHGWRTLRLSNAIAPDATAIRLITESRTTLPGRWIAVSDPLLVDALTLAERVPEGPVSAHWLATFWLPCAQAPAIADGIVEPPAAATTWADTAWDMNPWTPARGGLLAGAARLADIDTLDSSLPGVGRAWGTIHLFDYEVAEDAYELETSDVVTPGWRSAFPPVSQLAGR